MLQGSGAGCPEVANGSVPLSPDFSLSLNASPKLAGLLVGSRASPCVARKELYRSGISRPAKRCELRYGLPVSIIFTSIRLLCACSYHLHRQQRDHRTNVQITTKYLHYDELDRSQATLILTPARNEDGFPCKLCAAGSSKQPKEDLSREHHPTRDRQAQSHQPTNTRRNHHGLPSSALAELHQCRRDLTQDEPTRRFG